MALVNVGPSEIALLESIGNIDKARNPIRRKKEKNAEVPLSLSSMIQYLQDLI